MKNKYYVLNVEIACEFYQACIDRNIADDDIETKEKLLEEIGSKHEDFKIVGTNRTNEEIIRDMGKHYKKILHVKGNHERESI